MVINFNLSKKIIMLKNHVSLIIMFLTLKLNYQSSNDIQKIILILLLILYIIKIIKYINFYIFLEKSYYLDLII